MRSLLKMLSTPILLVKASSKNAHITWDKDKLKCMVQVEHTSRPLLKFVCSKILNAARNDKLLLVRGSAMINKTQQVRRILRLPQLRDHEGCDCNIDCFLLSGNGDRSAPA